MCEDGHESTEQPKSRKFSDYENGVPVANENPMILCDRCKKPANLVKRAEMTGQEKYESDRERNEVEKMVADKRQQAKAEEENAKGGEDAAKMFRGNAANGRNVADKLRSL
jgi:hypothetical protein